MRASIAISTYLTLADAGVGGASHERAFFDKLT
jgi:hypothetical protein